MTVPDHVPAEMVPAFVIPLSNVSALVIFPPLIVKSPPIVTFPEPSIMKSLESDNLLGY